MKIVIALLGVLLVAARETRDTAVGARVWRCRAALPEGFVGMALVGAIYESFGFHWSGIAGFGTQRRLARLVPLRADCGL